MNLNKRFAALVLSLIMIITMLPTAAFAVEQGAIPLDSLTYEAGEGKPFVKIGTTYTLQRDYMVPAVGIEIDTTAAITIDLNGYVLAADCEYAYSVDEQPKLLNIKNGTVSITSSRESATSTRAFDLKLQHYRNCYADLSGGVLCVFTYRANITKADAIISVQSGATLSIDGSVKIFNDSLSVKQTEKYVHSYERSYVSSSTNKVFYVGKGAVLNLNNVKLSSVGERIVRYGELSNSGTSDAAVSVSPAALSAGNTITNYGTVNLTDCVINSCGDVSNPDYEQQGFSYNDNKYKESVFCEDTPAIYNAGKLNITNCEIDNSPIFNEENASLDLQNTKIYSVNAYDESVYYGGGGVLVAPVYNKGSVSVSGSTRVGDMACEINGGIVMTSGSSLTVTSPLASRTDAYTEIPSVMVACSLDYTLEYLEAVMKGNPLPAVPNASVTYWDGVSGKAYDLGVSLLSRIAGIDIEDGALATAVYESSPLNINIADIVLNSKSTTAKFDLTASGFRTEDIKYIQQYLKIIELAVDNKLDDAAIISELNDDYLSGFFTRLSDFILKEANDTSNGKNERVAALKAAFEGQTDTLENLGRSYLASFIGSVGFLAEAEEDGNEAIKIEVFDSGKDFIYGIDEYGQTVTVAADNPKDVTINAYEEYSYDKQNKNTEYLGRGMRAHSGNVLFDDSFIESFEIMALLAQGYDFDRAVDMSGTAITLNDNDINHDNWRVGKYFMPAWWADQYDKNGTTTYTYCWKSNESYCKYKIYFVNDINVDLQKHAYNAYCNNGNSTQAAIECYASDISMLTGNYFVYEGGKLVVSQGAVWVSGLTQAEVSAAVNYFNANKDTIDWSSDTLPEALLFDAVWHTPDAVKNYYNSKLVEVKNDSNVMFDVLFELLTEGIILNSNTTVGGNSVFTLLNNALTATLSASNGTLSINLGASEVIESILGIVKAVCNTVYKDSNRTAVAKKYADVLYFNSEENKKNYVFPKSFNELCTLGEKLILDSSAITDMVASLISGEEVNDANARLTKANVRLVEAQTQLEEDQTSPAALAEFDAATKAAVEAKAALTKVKTDAVHTVISWLNNPSSAPAKIFAMSTVDSLPAMLSRKFPIGFNRVTEFTPDNPNTTNTNEESIKVDSKGVQTISGLLNTYGRYELSMSGTPLSLMVDSLTSGIKGKSIMGYSIGNLHIGHINVLPSVGSAPEVSEVVLDSNGTAAAVTITGDPALCYENGISEATITYWPADNINAKQTIVGTATTGASIQLERGEKSTDYFCTYSVKYNGKTYTSAATKFTIPSSVTGALFVYSSEGAITLVKGSIEYTPSGSVEAADVSGRAITTYNNLPVGVYNLKVTQGTKVKTYFIKMVKNGANAVAYVDGDTQQTYSSNNAGEYLIVELADDNELKTEVKDITTNKSSLTEDTDMSEIVASGLNKVDITTGSATKTYDSTKHGSKSVDELKNSDTTKLVLEVENLEEPDDIEEKDAIKEKATEANNNQISYIDLSVYLKDTTNEDNNVKVSELDSLITIYIPYDTSRSNIHIFRYHGDDVQEIPCGAANKNADGEYYEIDGAYIVLHVKNFSTYAVSYSENTVSPQPVVPVYYDDSDNTPAPVVKKCPQDDSCVLSKFIDIDTKAWYHDGVHFCVENNYMGGTGIDTFTPMASLSRGMVVTMLWRLEGQPQLAASKSYTDVSADKWYATAVAWAEANNIAGGYGSGKFGPEDPITREQLANVFYRYAAFKGFNTSAQADITAKFTDSANTHSWAETALKWANAEALINGKENNRLDPTGNASRAEAATILKNFCEKFIK